MKDVIRRKPGFADMRVALAAHYWSMGDLGRSIGVYLYFCVYVYIFGTCTKPHGCFLIYIWVPSYVYMG